MANRFPLIVDADTNAIKEIPAGDNLDFTSVGIANLQTLSVAGSISGAGLSVTGNITTDADISAVGNISSTGNITSTGSLSVGGTASVTGAFSVTGLSSMGAINASSNVTVNGTVDASNYTVSGQPLSSIQVQSDWNVADSNSAAFIRNKPSLAVTINRLADILDVFADYPADGTITNKIIQWDGFSWQGIDTPSSGGITTIATETGTASGQGSITAAVVGGTATLTYNPPTAIGIGAATSNQGILADSAVQPGAGLQVLSNVTTRYTSFDDIQVSDPLTKTPISGNQFSIGFDNAAPGAGFLTAESDTLASVTARGALTTTAITVPSIVANSASVASEFQNLEALGITVGATGISSTNGGITLTNGSITASNGTISAGTITGTNQVNTTGFMSTPLISNTAGDFTLQANATGRVQITQGYFKLPNNASRPATGETGDLHWNGQVLEMYTADDGGTNAGWLHLAGDSSAAQRGFIVPNFTTTERNALTPAPGEMILNSTTFQLEIYTGPTFGWRGVTLS